MSPRHLAAAALVLVLTLAGFAVTIELTERDADRASEQRVEIAAAQIQSRLAEATSLTDSLQQFMLDEASTSVTNRQFASNALRWLLPTGITAAAWAEQVRAPDRAAYERRLGRAIVTPGAQQAPVPPARSYLPATLVTGFPPMNRRGVDLRREAGLVAALNGPFGAGASPIAVRRDGTSGLFLVAPAPNVVDGSLRPGTVVVFVSEATLLAAARNPPGLRFGGGDRSGTVDAEFTVAGRRFSVILPRKRVAGSAAILPWLILAGGIGLAALTAALGANAARRAKAQADLDRIFNLSPDVIAVADFEGRFTRVNPAAEHVLGYTEEELLERPYLDFIHPDDREKTAAETAALGAGATTLSFENRYVRRDGSERALEWTATPVTQDRLVYSVARDVTERRQTEIEQAALRRVATLVATKGMRTEELFAVVAEEIARVVRVPVVTVMRFEPDDTATVCASFSTDGTNVVRGSWPMRRTTVLRLVRETSKPARIDDASGLEGEGGDLAPSQGIRSAVGSPIVVAGRTWGAVVAASAEQLPDDVAQRLADFTELLATAIANAESREALERLVEEQAALRRVATLVARGTPSSEVFAAVSDEVGRLFGTKIAGVTRFEDDGSALILVGVSKELESVIPVGTRWELGDALTSGEVFLTGRSARIDEVDWAGVEGPVAPAGRLLGVASTVASPIVVEGRLWGTATVSSSEPLPTDADERLEKFCEIAASAISNAESRSELDASRRRIVAASDAARRRIERDLHDGTQQRLVTISLKVQAAAAAAAADDDRQRAVLSEIRNELDEAIAELRSLSRGIHPGILSDGGLRPALRTLARRSSTPVEVDIETDARYPEAIEVAAYFVASEALANAAKHAGASRIELSLAQCDGTVVLSVRDDGVGGADAMRGSGLIGLTDRVETLGGTIRVESRPGNGTQIVAELPLDVT